MESKDKLEVPAVECYKCGNKVPFYTLIPLWNNAYDIVVSICEDCKTIIEHQKQDRKNGLPFSNMNTKLSELIKENNQLKKQMEFQNNAIENLKKGLREMEHQRNEFMQKIDQEIAIYENIKSFIKSNSQSEKEEYKQ
jgi:hypothetical protein